MWPILLRHHKKKTHNIEASLKDNPPNSHPYHNDQAFSSSFVTAATTTIQENEILEKDKEDEAVLCCASFLSEIAPCQEWFLPVDSRGREIDIQASFAPSSCSVIIFKFIGWGLSLVTLLYSWNEMKYPKWFFAYGSNGSLLLSSLYFTASLYNTSTVVMRGYYMSQQQQQSQSVVGCQIRITWILFEIAAHCEVAATILFWIFDYTPSSMTTTTTTTVAAAAAPQLSFIQVMSHAGIAVLVWVDGLYVNRIPVRLTHWYGFILPLDTAFVIWTAIQSYVGAINPYTGNTYIYAELDWREDWVRALVTSLVFIFVLGPVVFGMLWMVSLYHVPCFCYKDRRRYLEAFYNEGEEEQKLIVGRC